MPAVLLKMDHPCFFESNRGGDGFRLYSGFFAFFGLPIFSLGGAMIFSLAGEPTLVRTVSLAPKATSTNAKHDIAPSTLELKR
jgi:hypothetical protein